MNTPVDAVILIIAALASWLKTHKAALDLYLPVELDEPDEVAAVGYALELASNNYNRERREDVAQTAVRVEALTSGQDVMRSIIVIAEQQLKATGAHERAIKDFSTVAPSRLIYVPALRKAQRAARMACVTHKDALDADGKQRSAHMIKRLDESIARLDKASEDDVREEQETRAARRAFELAHERAIAAIDTLHAAARSAKLDTDAPLNDLAALYDNAHHRGAQRSAPIPDAPQGPTDDLG
jgi:hypothetical protein